MTPECSKASPWQAIGPDLSVHRQLPKILERRNQGRQSMLDQGLGPGAQRRSHDQDGALDRAIAELHRFFDQ